MKQICWYWPHIEISLYSRPVSGLVLLMHCFWYKVPTFWSYLMKFKYPGKIWAIYKVFGAVQDTVYILKQTEFCSRILSRNLPVGQDSILATIPNRMSFRCLEIAAPRISKQEYILVGSHQPNIYQRVLYYFFFNVLRLPGVYLFHSEWKT